MEKRCPHGSDVSRYDGMAFAAPFSQCQCCGVNFPYVDSGCWSSGGEEWSMNWTLDKCDACGGHYVETGTFPSAEI